VPSLPGLVAVSIPRRFNWRRSEVLIPSGSRHPSRFERAPDSCPVTSPWRKAAVLIRNAQRIQSASDGCRPPGRSTSHVRMDNAGSVGTIPISRFAIWCARLDSNQRSACYEQVALAAKLRAQIGQDGRLRSCDLSVPSRGLYQTELHPVELALRTGIKPASTRRQRVRLVRCATEQAWCAGSNRHDLSAASQTAASAIFATSAFGGPVVDQLVDLAGIEPALTRIKSPPLNRSATGL
jgi:hypothetical protein